MKKPFAWLSISCGLLLCDLSWCGTSLTMKRFFGSMIFHGIRDVLRKHGVETKTTIPTSGLRFRIGVNLNCQVFPINAKTGSTTALCETRMTCQRYYLKSPGRLRILHGGKGPTSRN